MDSAITKVYTVIIDGPITRRIRCPKSLREGAAMLLKRDGAMTKGQLADALGTHHTILDEHLTFLYSAGEIQRYMAVSPKQRRAHEFWCITGQRPASNRYRGAETLEAFQIAALAWQGREVRA
jgi:predicted ArsR family transcriptional regulator